MSHETSSELLRRTPLFECHKSLGAKLVPFGGWHMPVQYSSVLDEHHAVRTQVGLFDVSHMGELVVSGRGATEFLQKMTLNDVSVLNIGQAQYSAMCYENGTLVDDIVIYKRGHDCYFICVNASNTQKDFDWLKTHAPKQGVTLEDLSSAYAQIAVQGPHSRQLVQKIVDISIHALPYYAFSEGKVLGQPGLVARTGYTGELGYELYINADSAQKVWSGLLDAGSALGVKPCGLGARDTLRLEVGYLLYGNDMNDTTSAWECGLGWITKLQKSHSFIGQSALIEQKKVGLKRKLVAFKMIDKAIARQGHLVSLEENSQPLSPLEYYVTSGTVAPSVHAHVGLCYLPTDAAGVGSEFWIDVRGHRKKAVVCKKPFYTTGTALAP